MTRGASHISGIVLAGGAGRRVGGPKARLRLGDATLAQHAVTVLGALCTDVVVVTRPEVPVQVHGARVVHDGPGPDAPLTGIVAGLEATAGDEVLVLACDLPFAAPALGRLLAGPPGRAAIATGDGHPQPLCARYPRRVALQAARLMLSTGQSRAVALAEALAAVHVPVPTAALFNINGTDDLRHARAAHALLRATGRPVSSGNPTRPSGLLVTATVEGAR